MTTYKDLIDDLRLRFNDVEQNKISTPLLFRVLKEAINDIVEDVGGLLDNRYCYSIKDRGLYLLDTDIKSIEQVYYDGDLLKYMNYKDFVEDNIDDVEDIPSGRPYVYTTVLYGTENRKVLVLYPYPSLEDKIIRITAKIYYPNIDESNMNDDILLPEEMTRSVRDLATFYLARELNNIEMMKIWITESEKSKVLARPTKKAYRTGESIDV